jgi:hypothetical protein
MYLALTTNFLSRQISVCFESCKYNSGNKRHPYNETVNPQITLLRGHRFYRTDFLPLRIR